MITWLQSLMWLPNCQLFPIKLSIKYFKLKISSLKLCVFVYHIRIGGLVTGLRFDHCNEVSFDNFLGTQCEQYNLHLACSVAAMSVVASMLCLVWYVEEIGFKFPPSFITLVIGQSFEFKAHDKRRLYLIEYVVHFYLLDLVDIFWDLFR